MYSVKLTDKNGRVVIINVQTIDAAIDLAVNAVANRLYTHTEITLTRG